MLLNKPPIKILSKEHAKVISELERDCFSLPWSEEVYKSYLEDTNQNNLTLDSLWQNRFISARTVFGIIGVDKSLIAYASLSVNSTINECELYNIAVAKVLRNQGYGRYLLSRVLQLAAYCGIRKCFLEVRESGLAAISLYESLGFTCCGYRKKYYSDNGEDAIVMVCKLFNLI